MNISHVTEKIPRKTLLTGMMLSVTLAAFVLALIFRWILGYPPLSFAAFKVLDFDPYTVGFAVQELVLPVVLVAIFSRADLYRRAITDTLTHQETLKLFLVLAVIQFLALNYYLGLDLVSGGSGSAFGFLIVIVGALLGGWRVGLGLGIVTFITRGTQDFIVSPDNDLILQARTEGLRALLHGSLWGKFLFRNFIANFWASAAIWAGIVSGLCTELSGNRRFVPLTGFLLGVGIDCVGGLLMATASADPASFIEPLLPNMAVSGLAMAVIALIVGGVQAEISQRKVEVAELARTQSELRALVAQINPHFLFNALNTIRYFVRIDPEAARKLLLSLSEVFQRSIRAGEFVPLRSEISYVEAYLSLEKARLDKRLHIVWSVNGHDGDVPDSPLLDHTVPTLILQPIVENAILHGVSKKAEGGTVRIAIEQSEGNLLLQVLDNGVGIEPARMEEILGPPPPNNTSIGLRNVDRRLRVLYGDGYRLKVKSEAGNGTQVQIKLPLEIRKSGTLELRGRFDSFKFKMRDAQGKG